MSRILLFIPIYNCERQIGRVFDKMTPDLLAHIAEVIVVDNGSSDKSCAIVAERLKSLPVSAALLRNNANYNLGGSLKVAFNYALDHGYDHLLVLHGDDQADVRDIVRFLANGQAFDADLFIGARFHPHSRLQGYSRLRIAGNKALGALLSVITRVRIDDMIAGLNLYSMKAFKERWYLDFPDNLTFDAHMLLGALHRRLHVRYFPISWREEDQVSNAKVFRQGCILLKLFLGYAVMGEKIFQSSINPLQHYTFMVLYRNQIS
jgi:glycosyltransferase involved in cell wall biosynthesis